MPRKPIDKEIVKQIQKLYLEGVSIPEIAKRLNVSPFTANKYVKGLNRTIPTQGEKERLINAAKILGFDEDIVKKVMPKLTKRETILYALSIIRLRPFIEMIEKEKKNDKSN